MNARVYTFEERWARAAKLARELRAQLKGAESSDDWLDEKVRQLKERNLWPTRNPT